MKPDAAPPNVIPARSGPGRAQDAGAPGDVAGGGASNRAAEGGQGAAAIVAFSKDAPALPSVLAARLDAAAQAAGLAPPRVIPAECVSLFALELPVRGTAKRLAALPFALEEELAAPLEQMHVALGPEAGPQGAAAGTVPDPSAPPRVLAAAVAREVMVIMAARHGKGPVLPEMLAVPRPDPAPDGAARWAVWRTGARCVLRLSDGTGFALRTDMLAPLWERAGRPAVVSMGEALPKSFGAEDLSAAPPPPDPVDLSFDLAQGAFAEGVSGWGRTARLAAIAAAMAGAAHLALLFADVTALGRIAQAERLRAQEAVAAVLPGVTVGPQTAPLLSRLAPVAAAPAGSAFLPLLGASADALLGARPAPGFRRLSFSAAEPRLTVLVEASGLEALQSLEQLLREGGLEVATGAATAADGAAQAEFRIRPGAGQ